MGLDRLIGVSWVSLCLCVGGPGGALCVEPMLEVEGEREEKNTVGKLGKCD